MKQITYESLGVDVKLSVPADAAEYNALFPRKDELGNPVDACAEDAIDSVVFRSVLNKFRSRFVEVVAFKSGIARKVTKDAAGKVEGFAETEGKFVDRVCVETGVENLSCFQTEADLCMTGWAADPNAEKDSPFAIVAEPIKFDASAQVRTGGKKKTPKYIVEAIDQAIAAGQADKLATILSEKTGTTVLNTKESLCKALHDMELAAARQAAAEAAAKRNTLLAGLKV